MLSLCQPYSDHRIVQIRKTSRTLVLLYSKTLYFLIICFNVSLVRDGKIWSGLILGESAEIRSLCLRTHKDEWGGSIFINVSYLIFTMFYQTAVLFCEDASSCQIGHSWILLCKRGLCTVMVGSWYSPSCDKCLSMSKDWISSHRKGAHVWFILWGLCRLNARFYIVYIWPLGPCCKPPCYVCRGNFLIYCICIVYLSKLHVFSVLQKLQSHNSVPTSANSLVSVTQLGPPLCNINHYSSHTVVLPPWCDLMWCHGLGRG